MKKIVYFRKIAICLIGIIAHLCLSCEKEYFVPMENLDDGASLSPEHFFLETSVGHKDLVYINYQNQRILVEKVDDYYLFEGDIIVQEDRNGAKSVGRTSNLWEDNTVYYTIAEDLTGQYRILDAIAHWESNTNLRFLLKTEGTEDYISFVPGSGCSSAVGRIGGQQFINLSSSCSTGNVIHEIGHAIGLWHEQSRKDRDEHIDIWYENIKTDKVHNFKTYVERYQDGDEYTSYFDFESIMMYPYNAFSINGLPTITKKNGSIYNAQRDGLSDGDVFGVSNMYPTIWNPTKNDDLPTIENPSFSIRDFYKEGNTSTCSCVAWYHPNFVYAPLSSTDSHDYAGTQGGGSIKLTNYLGQQKTAYQLLKDLSPGVTYKLKFYYAIKNSGTIGALDFRVLSPEANTPALVTAGNTIAQFTGLQTISTNSIKGAQGGGQSVTVEFTPNTTQVALYAVNSVYNGSDVRIDNFTIEKAYAPSIPEIKNPSFSIKDTYENGSDQHCSCASWYHPNFLYPPHSSTDSNDDPGTQGGGSIKLTNYLGQQKTAYQLLSGVSPGVTYTLKFYYAIKNLGNNIGALDFRVLKPEANTPNLVLPENTLAQFVGSQTPNTNAIKATQGGGQLVTLQFTAYTSQVALYAVNAVDSGSDVRIDNFSIEINP